MQMPAAAAAALICKSRGGSSASEVVTHNIQLSGGRSRSSALLKVCVFHRSGGVI